MDSNYRARPYHEGEEAQIIPLLVSAFGLWPFTNVPCAADEHWRWRYNDKYPGHVIVVPYGEKIVSCDHATINNYQVMGKSQLASYVTDTAVHVEHQGNGLYKVVTNSLMSQGEEADIKFSYTISTNPVVLKSSTFKENWPHTFPFNICRLTRIQNLGKHAKVSENELGLRWRIKETISKLKDKPIKDPEYLVSEIKLFDHRIEKLLNNIKENYDFILNRTQSYLNWRYCDPRGGSYNIKVVEDQDEILGYIVSRIRKTNEYYSGYIVDLLTMDNRLDVAETLFLSAMQYFQVNNVNIVRYQVIKNHPFEMVFKRYGFRARGDPRIIHCSYDEIDELKRIEPSRIHFPFGDIAEH